MEGFCRGCLIKCDEPTDLIPYSEKNRRLFIYSTGLQVKRNDTITFQLCKDCYLNMKQACIFKKQCRNSEKKLRNYMSLKENGDAIDFCSYIKNCEDLLTIRLPLASGNSTPVHQKTKEDDNESTCTSIRNFMSDILQGEEVPDTEARIIKELIEEEADVLDDSLDSHWLQDDMSIATDFRMDFSFSPFSNPRSVQNDNCYTPKRLNDDKDDYFTIKQIEKPPDEQYHMPLIDDCEIDIDQPANIPMEEIETECFTQKKSKNHEINNLKVNETEYVSYTKVENQNYDINNVKLGERESHNYKTNNLKLNKTENQNYEVNKTVKIKVNSKSERETYFVEQITEIKTNEIVEDNFLHIRDKTRDFISTTEIENDFYNITNDSNQSKIGKKIDESLLNNELEYYISKAELKKNRTEVDNKCLIDRNLEKALENEDNKEIPLDILLSSPKVEIRSGASTPTIRNILFGDTLLDSNDMPKLGQCIEKYDPIEGQTNILDDFLKDEDSNNIASVKMKEEIVSDYTLKSLDLVKNKVEILEIKIIKEKDIEEKHDTDNKFIEEKKSEDIKYLIEDYVTNVYVNINLPKEDITDDEIDALELLKATNTTLDESLFKRPMSPLYDKYDLENGECKICNKTFKTPLILKIHFAKKHKFKIVTTPNRDYLKAEVICDVCGHIAKGKANFNRHKRQAHGVGVGEFFCKECSLRFTTQRGLTIHRKSHRENIKNTSKVYTQICNICGKRLSTENYKLHLLRHLKEYKFKCDFCHKGFYRQCDFMTHLRTHTNIRPFKCKICPKSYKRRVSLKRHNERHLEKEEYICDICSTIFTSKRRLIYHFGTKMCNPANKASDEQCNLANKASDDQCNLASKASDEQCNLASKASDEYCNLADKASDEQCNLAIKASDEQCNPANKASDEQCSLANKTSDDQCNLANKASTEKCNSAKKTSGIITENVLETSNIFQKAPVKKTEDIIIEELEFTVKFSPVSVKEDEPSDPLLDLY